MALQLAIGRICLLCHMLEITPWFFGLLAGAIFGVIVGYLDPHSSDANLFGTMGVFACVWLWLDQSLDREKRKRP